MLRSAIAVSAAGLVGTAHAFWRMECPGRVGLARMDPIVDFGELSPHVHSIHGSSGFSEKSHTADLLNGEFYFKDGKTGELELVEQVGGMLAYYLLNGEDIKAFPTDFRMLAGSTERRVFTVGDPTKSDPDKSTWFALGQTTQDDLEQRAMGFNCLNYGKDPEGTLYRHYLPDKEYLDANCADGLRFEVMFPSCWDGENLDSTDHKSHVAYPDLVMTGNCPKDFPIRLPGLLYETIWATNAFEGRDGMFVMANGDPTGFGYHADFIMGWEEDFLQQAVDTCTNDSGRIEDCPLFNVVSESKARECEMKLPDSLLKEDVDGPLAKLPGGVEITYETGSTDEDKEVPAPAETLSYSAGAQPSKPAEPLPGQVFKETSAYVPEASSTSSSSIAEPAVASIAAVENQQLADPTTSALPPPPPPAPTVQPEMIVLEDPNVSYWSTEYKTNGNVVSKVLWQEEVVWVTEQVDATTTIILSGPVPAPTEDAVPAQIKRRAAHLHAYGHRHL